MPRQVQVVILCEDRQHDVFVRRFLIARGANRRKIRTEICPSGAGDQHVLERYHREVSEFRRRSSFLRICLIVVVDADKSSVAKRLRDLDSCLTNRGMERRNSQERIVLLVPKRNIETWIYHLNGTAVDEDTAYRKLDEERDCVPAVKRLIEIYPLDVPNDAPPSLRIAWGEKRRCGS